MMGEIRDEESVEALMRLSSSGHRAISTLHTNSACEVPNRLFLFRAQPFMVADSLKGAPALSTTGFIRVVLLCALQVSSFLADGCSGEHK